MNIETHINDGLSVKLINLVQDFVDSVIDGAFSQLEQMQKSSKEHQKTQINDEEELMSGMNLD